jgi:hypothetical protein
MLPYRTGTFYKKYYKWEISHLMKILLLLPTQSSRFSDLYNVFNDLHMGLGKIGYKSEIVEIKKSGVEGFPYSTVRNIEIDALGRFINDNVSDDTYFVTVDDIDVMKEISRIGKIQNFLVWAHYFFGARFIFKRYRQKPYENFGVKRHHNLFGLVPSNIFGLIGRSYYSALKNNGIVAQSLWTDLLMERVYNIDVKGVLYIPIEASYYVTSKEKEDKVLIFLGNDMETDLYSLESAIRKITRINSRIEFDSFGNRDTMDFFNKRFNRNIKYLGKLERKDLNTEYSRHLATIAPIYNGNFEMVPIQSLLCGTPVISFMQPFMEVTGRSSMIANIQNINDVEVKSGKWINRIYDNADELTQRILGIMGNDIIAEEMVHKYLLVS